MLPLLLLLAAAETAFDAEPFQPAAGHGAFLAVESAAEAAGWEAGAAFGAERRPLLLRNPALGGALEATPIDVRATLDLHAAFAHGPWVAAAGLPLAFQSGDRLRGTGLDDRELGAAAPGDLRLLVRRRLWEQPGRAALAAGLRLALPTGGGDDFAGGRLEVEPRLLGEVTVLRARLRLGANLGLRLGPERDFFDAHIGPAALEAGGAAEWAVPWPRRLRRLRDVALLVGEAAGSWGGSESPAPFELRGALRVRWRGWILDGGGGAGLVHEPLAPAWRAFAVVRWERD